MNVDIFSDITNQAIKVSLMIASPMLMGSLFIGILVSIFQTVTQINEQTLSFIPKVIVIVGSIVIFSPWMTDTLATFTKNLILSIPQIIAQQ